MGTHAASHHDHVHVQPLIAWTTAALIGLLVLAAVLMVGQRLADTGGTSVQTPGAPGQPGPHPRAQSAPVPR
jgi:hypothetical protein